MSLPIIALDARAGVDTALRATRTGSEYRDASRILLVRLDAMGDLIMTTPAIRAVRRGAPLAHIGLLTSRVAAPIAALLPEIDSVHAVDVPWQRTTRGQTGDVARESRTIIATVAQGGYEAAIVFAVNSQSPLPTALVLALAGVERRAAYCRENPYDLLTDWLPEPEPGLPSRHEVRRQLDLVAALGFEADGSHLSVLVPPAAARRARGLLRRLGLEPVPLRAPTRPWAVISPGASAASRRYPPERFAEVGRVLAQHHGWRFLVTGTIREQEVAAAVAAGIGASAVSLAGRLEVEDLAALLACAPLLISGNSAPVHLGAAVGTPVVDIYALTNPQHTPWGVPSRVLTNPVPCAGCRRSVCPEGHHACLLGIEPERVVEAALELAAQPRAATTAAVA